MTPSSGPRSAQPSIRLSHRAGPTPIYTFWDYFRNAFGRNAGLRIDHLLLSPSLADRLVDAQVDVAVRGWEKSSDHAPVWIELSDKTKHRRRSSPQQPRNRSPPV